MLWESNLSRRSEKTLSTAADEGERMKISSASKAQVGNDTECILKKLRIARPTISLFCFLKDFMSAREAHGLGALNNHSPEKSLQA